MLRKMFCHATKQEVEGAIPQTRRIAANSARVLSCLQYRQMGFMDLGLTTATEEHEWMLLC
jgi:hypothetical protein